MKLQLPDLAIIIAYLITMMVIGWVLRKKARQNNQNYLMGGKSLPWYMLGLSDASDMFDISGTMWMVSLCFVWNEKHLDSVVVARIQPGIYDDVPVAVVAQVQCYHGCRMACKPFRDIR